MMVTVGRAYETKSGRQFKEPQVMGHKYIE